VSVPELVPVTAIVPIENVPAMTLVLVSVKVSVTVAGVATVCAAEAEFVSASPSLVNAHVIWSSTAGVIEIDVPVPDGSVVDELTALVHA